MKKILILVLLVFCSQMTFADIPAKIEVETATSNKNVDVTVTISKSNEVEKTSADVKLKMLDDINTQAKEAAEYLPKWFHSKALGVELWQVIAAFIFILLGLILRKINNYIFSNIIFS